jgi:hypothetical protein
MKKSFSRILLLCRLESLKVCAWEIHIFFLPQPKICPLGPCHKSFLGFEGVPLPFCKSLKTSWREIMATQNGFLRTAVWGSWLCGYIGKDFLLLRRCFGETNVGLSATLFCVIQGEFSISLKCLWLVIVEKGGAYSWMCGVHGMLWWINGMNWSY